LKTENWLEYATIRKIKISEMRLESTPANILVVDDVEDNRIILGDLLTFDGHKVQTAEDGESALKLVHESHPDLILLDILMPGMSGYEVCEYLKADDETKDIPVIFVSSMADIESKVQGFKIGGVDYINKPFQHAEILVRVNTHVTLQKLRKDLEERNAELERLAATDYLTNLYNRRRFFHAAQNIFSDATQTGHPLSITLLDLDYFKHVNDTHGHLVGDQVLIHVAHLIRDYCRENDMAARYGGEEFAILHPSIDGGGAFEVVDGIRKRVEETPYVCEANEIDMTLSAGIVDTKTCPNCPRIDDVLGLADKALYQAKDGGRNRVVVFEG